MITATLIGSATYILYGKPTLTKFVRDVPQAISEEDADHLEAWVPGYFIIDSAADPNSLFPRAPEPEEHQKTENDGSDLATTADTAPELAVGL